MTGTGLISCPLAKRSCPARKVAAPQLVGWREWVGLPDLDIPKIKVKVDSGALTSAIHAYDIRPFQENGQQFVEFTLHPVQEDDETTVLCRAAVVDQREITSSSGHSDERFVIETTLKAGPQSWPIELALANRDDMGFRMLLGRQAMRRHLIIDPNQSFCLS